METVKKENERILRAEEELNQILMEKFQSEGKDKQTGSENTSYQHKSKKSKPSKIESSSSSEIYGDSHRKNRKYTNASVKIIIIQEKENLSLMNKFRENLRK